jgi:hypothetical protein
VFDSYSGVIGSVRAGQVRALAVTNPTRWPLAPEFPTVQEQGVANYDLPSFSAVMGPKGIPEPIVARMNSVINEGLKNPAMVERLAGVGNAPFPNTPAMFWSATSKLLCCGSSDRSAFCPSSSFCGGGGGSRSRPRENLFLEPPPPTLGSAASLDSSASKEMSTELDVTRISTLHSKYTP